MTRGLRILVVLLALGLAAPLAACGEEEESRTVAHTEAIYLEVGDLFYQVQISRELNPLDPEDEAYFVALPDDEPPLRGSEAWFGVFVRAWNLTDSTHPSASEFRIEDTTGRSFEPVEFGEENIFAYRPDPVPANDTLPGRDTIALTGPAGGSLLLFRLDADALANRPLELITRAPGTSSPEYIFTLDV